MSGMQFLSNEKLGNKEIADLQELIAPYLVKIPIISINNFSNVLAQLSVELSILENSNFAAINNIKQFVLLKSLVEVYDDAELYVDRQDKAVFLRKMIIKNIQDYIAEKKSLTPEQIIKIIDEQNANFHKPKVIKINNEIRSRQLVFSKYSDQLYAHNNLAFKDVCLLSKDQFQHKFKLGMLHAQLLDKNVTTKSFVDTESIEMDLIELIDLYRSYETSQNKKDQCWQEICIKIYDFLQPDEEYRLILDLNMELVLDLVCGNGLNLSSLLNKAKYLEVISLYGFRWLSDVMQICSVNINQLFNLQLSQLEFILENPDCYVIIAIKTGITIPELLTMEETAKEKIFSSQAAANFILNLKCLALFSKEDILKLSFDEMKQLVTDDNFFLNKFKDPNTTLDESKLFDVVAETLQRSLNKLQTYLQSGYLLHLNDLIEFPEAFIEQIRSCGANYDQTYLLYNLLVKFNNQFYQQMFEILNICAVKSIPVDDYTHKIQKEYSTTLADKLLAQYVEYKQKLNEFLNQFRSMHDSFSVIGLSQDLATAIDDKSLIKINDYCQQNIFNKTINTITCKHLFVLSKCSNLPEQVDNFNDALNLWLEEIYKSYPSKYISQNDAFAYGTKFKELYVDNKVSLSP